MKTIRRIQNVMIAVGVITAVALSDGMEVPSSNLWAAFVILGFSALTIVERELKNENGKGASDEEVQD